MPALDDDREEALAQDKIIAVEDLRKIIDHDPETGALVWKSRPLGPASWNTRYAGTSAMAATSGHQGYRAGFINRTKYYAHRVMWALHYGEWPKTGIDHIDGDRSNNRVSNLRLADCVENGRNASRSTRNTSGRTGVFKVSNTRWTARIGVAGRYIVLGSFCSFAAACEAREKAERSHGFHKNHGREKAA